MTKKLVCFICRKPCSETDRNNDGTYAHDDCLRKTQTYPRM